MSCPVMYGGDKDIDLLQSPTEVIRKKQHMVFGMRSRNDDGDCSVHLQNATSSTGYRTLPCICPNEVGKILRIEFGQLGHSLASQHNQQLLLGLV